MKTVIEEYGNLAIVRAIGKITIGKGDIVLRNVLAKLAELGHCGIILDLSMVTYMDSSGLGELVQTYEHLQSQGISLCLTRVNTRVYDLLSLTRLVAVFPIYDSIEDAIMTMGKAA